MDLLSEDNLESMILCDPVGDAWPYDAGSDQEIETYLRSTVDELKRSPHIVVEADFTSYGCGYASYADVFCYPRDGSSQQTKEGVLYIDGITVYLGRLAPLAVLGALTKFKDKHSEGYGSLEADTVDTLPDGDCTDFVREVRTKISKRGFTFLDRETASRPLPFSAEI